MANHTVRISEIDNTKIQCVLKARIIRLWEAPDRNRPDTPFFLELVLQDEQGDRIQATIGRPYTQAFRRQLNELNIYYFKLFVVCLREKIYRTNSHKWKLTFTNRTSVEETNDPSFSLSFFQFRPFEEVLKHEEDNDNDTLFDIIGELISYGAVGKRLIGTTLSDYMDVELRDLNGIIIHGTFWGEFIDQIQPHLDGPKDIPIVVVMQMITCKKFNGRPTVRNAWDPSKLWINSGLPQITDFISRLNFNYGESSQRLTQLSSQPPYSVGNELIPESEGVKTIAQVLEGTKDGVWILATTALLQIRRGNWSYLCCTKCPAGATRIGDKFYCKRCDISNTTANHRFRIQVLVADETNSLSLTIWDKDAFKIIGKSANELRNTCVETTMVGNSDSYPMELDTILGKQFLFKITKNSGMMYQQDVYNVNKLSDDPDLIKKYLPPAQDDPCNSFEVTGPHHNVEDISNMESISETAINLAEKLTLKPTLSTAMTSTDDVPAEQLSSNTNKRVVKKKKLR